MAINYNYRSVMKTDSGVLTDCVTVLLLCCVFGCLIYTWRSTEHSMIIQFSTDSNK